MSAFNGHIEGEDFGEEGAAVSYTAASARSAALNPGRYYMVSTTDCWVKRGTSAAAVATAAAPSQFLKASTYWPFIISVDDVGTRDAVAAIRDSADGSLRIGRVNRK